MSILASRSPHVRLIRATREGQNRPKVAPRCTKAAKDSRKAAKDDPEVAKDAPNATS